MDNHTVRLKKIFILAGAICAYWIGAGFSTGQEVLQFFAVNGIKGIWAAGLCCILTCVFSYTLWNLGQREDFENPYDAFQYYCGKYLGQVYIWFSVVLSYGIFVVMMAGGGATIHQYFGVPTYLGTGFIGILSLLTVLLGVDRLINIIGVIGPVKILFVVVIGIAALFSALDEPAMLMRGDALMPTLGFQSASDNWAWSGALYAFLALMMSIPFQVTCGSQAANKREARIGAIVGGVMFTVAIIFLVLAEIVYHALIVGQQVPTLAIANHVSPLLGLTFSIIIVLCIYSAVASVLLMVVRKFAVDKTKTFNTVAVVLTSIGMFFGSVIPFDKLVNLLFPITGYAAILFAILMLFKEARRKSAAPSTAFTEVSNAERHIIKE
ncbi:MAG: hypothetical protein E6713_05855 [Sporomusaceae bacterium]|nr:hypothetical protein [Sporomusaceae bacterium]